MSIIDEILKNSLSYYQVEKECLERKREYTEKNLLEIKDEIIKLNRDLDEIQKEINARQNQTIL